MVIDPSWDVTNARVACKKIPNAKVINLQMSVNNNTLAAYEIFMSHLTDLQEVYESLIDEESKKTFCGYWLGNISHQFGELVHSDKPHYILEGFIPKEGAVVIAAGAADGGTATAFSAMGYKVHTFEMDSKNFEVAKKTAEENDFIVENMGLGSYKHEVNYNPSESGSSIIWNGSEKAQITAIDSYVRENNIPRVDFIKLDVEGAELDTLKGARTCIARYKPILAISAYHRNEDFWTLMNFVKSIRPDYEFAMRHYMSYDGEISQYVDIFGLEPAYKNWWECCILAR